MVAFLIYDHQDISYLLLVGLHPLDHSSYSAFNIFEVLPTSYARFWKFGTKPTLHPQEQPQRLTLKPHQRTLQLQAIQDEYQAWILQNASQACSSNIISQFTDHPECLVYELLQNSVDSGATSVRYDLVPKMSHTRLIVTHDGRPFNLADVHGLTNFANSTKVPNSNVIGYMGLGFKSIFAVAEMVTITSGFLSFRYSRRRNGRFIWIEFSLLDTCISPPDPHTVVEINLETSATEAVWNRIRDMTSSKALLILASLDKPLRSISVTYGDFKAHLQVKDPIWIRYSNVDYQVTHWNGIDYLLVRQGSRPSDYVCLCVTLSRTEVERQIGRIYTFLPLVDEKNPHIIDIHAPFKVNSRRESIERNRQDRSNSDLWQRIASTNAQMMIVLYNIYHREHQELLKRLFWRLIPPTTSQIRRHFEALFATLPLSWTLPENQLQLSTSQAILKPRDPLIVDTSYFDLSQLSQEDLSHVLPLFPRSSSSSDFATFWGRPGKLTDPLALFKSPIPDLKTVRNRGVEMVSKAFTFDYHWTLEAMARIDELCGSRLSPKDEVSKESHASLSALLHLVLSHPHQLKHVEYLKKSNSTHYYDLSLEEPCSFIKSLQNRRWISIRFPSPEPSRFVLYEPRSVIIGTLLEDEMLYYPSRLNHNNSYLELRNNGLGIIDAQSLQGIICRLIELKRFWLSQARLYSNSLVNSRFFLQCAAELYHVIPKQDLESQLIRDAFAQHELIYNHKSDCWLKPQQTFLDNRDDTEGLQESYPEDRVLFSALGVPDTPSLSRLSATLQPLRSRTTYELDQDRRLQNIYTIISKKLDSAATNKEANLDSSDTSLITKILECPILVSVSKSIMDMKKPIFMFDSCMALESLLTRSSKDELEESFVHPSLLSSMSPSTRIWLSNLCSNVRTVSFPILTSAPPADATHPEGQRIIRTLNDALNALNRLLEEAYKSKLSPCLSKFEFQFQYCHTRSIEAQWCDQPTELTGACHDRTFLVCIKNRPFVWTGLFTWMFSTQGPFPRFSTDFPRSSASDLVPLLARYFRSVLEEGVSEQARNSALEKCRGHFLQNISISPQIGSYSSKASNNSLTLTSLPSSSTSVSLSRIGLVQQTPRTELPSPAATSSSSSFNTSQSSPIVSLIPIIGSHMGKTPTMTSLPSPQRTSIFAPPGTPTASFSNETSKADSNSPFVPSALTRTLTPPIPWTPSPGSSPTATPISSASSIPHPSIPRTHLKSGGSSRSSSSNFSGTPMTSEQMRINNERGLLAEEAALRYEHFRLRTHPAFQELPFLKNALPSDMDAYQLLERHVCLTRKSEVTSKNPDLQFSDAAAWDIHTFSYLNHSWVPSKLEVKCTKNSGESFYLSKREHKNAWEATQGGPPYIIYFYKEFKEEIVKGMVEQVLPPTAALCIQSQKDWEDNLEIKEEVSYRVTFKNISRLLVEELSAPFDG